MNDEKRNEREGVTVDRNNKTKKTKGERSTTNERASDHFRWDMESDGGGVCGRRAPS